MSPQGRAVMQGIVDDLYDQFVGMVARGRRMEPANAPASAPIGMRGAHLDVRG